MGWKTVKKRRRHSTPALWGMFAKQLLYCKENLRKLNEIDIDILNKKKIEILPKIIESEIIEQQKVPEIIPFIAKYRSRCLFPYLSTREFLRLPLLNATVNSLFDNFHDNYWLICAESRYNWKPRNKYRKGRGRKKNLNDIRRNKKLLFKELVIKEFNNR